MGEDGNQTIKKALFTFKAIKHALEKKRCLSDSQAILYCRPYPSVTHINEHHMYVTLYIRCSVLLEQNNKKIAISCQQTVTQSDFIPHFYFCFFFSGKLLLCWIGQLLYTIYIDNNNNNNTSWQIRSTHGVVSRKFHWGLFSTHPTKVESNP